VGQVQGARIPEPVGSVPDEKEGPRRRHLHERPSHGHLRVRVGAEPLDGKRVAVAQVLREGRHDGDADVGGDVAGDDLEARLLESPGDVEQEAVLGPVLDDNGLAVVSVVLGDAPGVALDDLREGMEDGLLDRVARGKAVGVRTVEEALVAVEGVINLPGGDEDFLVAGDVVARHPMQIGIRAEVAELGKDECRGVEGVACRAKGVVAADNQPVGPFLAELRGESLDRLQGKGDLRLDGRGALAGVEGPGVVRPQAPAGEHGDADAVQGRRLAEVLHPEKVPHAPDEAQGVVRRLRAVRLVDVELRAAL